ncbi:Leukocyte receptor cluster member 8 homolog [Seminavis robusta]|uniref:Leukocyte receptor cluster member 8 homolog n=1 Tax=Seminavis robusta TaxID=568900 RepID=A0A9N8DL72_9STRA|nr:Leukocyte receptor cluster member 8 homolog [Seminavis robusta]|eukprot:Sro142_g066420.1 Leukocyte receptor cluster member 8 homolog (464) ;mRNA; r:98664-100170
MMVSTLQPPPRKHKKKKKDTLSGRNTQDILKNGLSSVHPHSKKRKEQPSLKTEIAAVYEEDLGLAGIKKAKTSTISSPILQSSSEGRKLQISETAEEKLRRLRRKARFDAEGGRNKSATKKKSSNKLSAFTVSAAPSKRSELPKEPDFLSKALSSGRRDAAASVGSRKGGTKSSQSRHGQLVGTSQALEKPYLRLTTHARAEDVRPMEVLIKSLAHIKSKYYQEEDFEWANEQLKSVRQDITVQRLRNRFVLETYETHARILLEHGDLAEFNQCQTMIRYLTTTGLEHEDTMATMSNASDLDTEEGEALQQTEEASDEFRAYHVLYSLVQTSWDDLTRALVRVREIIREKEENGCKTASARHSLGVMKAVVHSDYHAFFKLYESAPHMSAYLMDFLVKRMREMAYERIIAAYRPTICVEYFRGALHFPDMEETRLFLRQMGAKFVRGEQPPLWVDCKASISRK